MKIAVIFPGFTGPYGAERLLLNLCSEFIKMKNEVTLFTTRYDHSCDGMRHRDLEIIETGHFKVENWDLSKLIEHYSVAKIYKYIDNSFDIINTHNYPTPLAVGLAKKLRKIDIPVVYQCNEPPRAFYDLSFETYKRFNLPKRIALFTSSEIFKKIDRWSINNVDKIITISKFIQNQIMEIYNRDSFFIMPGIEVEKFNPYIDGTEIRQQYAKEGDFIVLTCNKLHPRKRIDVLIKAVPHIIKKCKNIKVIITGDGIEREKLQTLMNELNIQSCVKLVGFIPDHQLPKYYAACDVFAFTALREPQIGSVAEALATGKPVIVPNDGSPAETILEGKTGFLYRPLDHVDLAERIIRCANDRDKLKQMEKDCRKWVEENMTYERMAGETYKVFNSLQVD